MSILRKNCVSCVPESNSFEREFLFSRSVMESVPVFNKDGVKIREQKVKRVVYDKLPAEEWENKGIDASLFSLENQIASGVPVSQFTGNFIGLDLDVSDSLGSKFINGVNNFVAAEKQKIESKKQKIEINEKELNVE